MNNTIDHAILLSLGESDSLESDSRGTTSEERFLINYFLGWSARPLSYRIQRWAFWFFLLGTSEYKDYFFYELGGREPFDYGLFIYIVQKSTQNSISLKLPRLRWHLCTQVFSARCGATFVFVFIIFYTSPSLASLTDKQGLLLSPLFLKALGLHSTRLFVWRR